LLVDPRRAVEQADRLIRTLKADLSGVAGQQWSEVFAEFFVSAT
jgi:hypothetical protein